MEMSFSMIRARIGETPDSAERRRTSRLPVDLDARVRELGNNGVHTLDIEAHDDRIGGEPAIAAPWLAVGEVDVAAPLDRAQAAQEQRRVIEVVIGADVDGDARRHRRSSSHGATARGELLRIGEIRW